MPRAARSSLADHRFPAFYACYLLKSVRTPRATATYIGSTPSPPRRLRQHNGEISQGAWKTKHNRPWIMQMIVHGFPSKLAALQFEWAWQHPSISRHLRDSDGQAVFNHSGKFKYLTTNVRVARSMVSSHPYNTWPLRVKLFTEEAEKAWNQAATAAGMPPLPPGLQVTAEFEGVDGKSGKPGSGRSGPIDVTDGTFTAEHLRKASVVFSPGSVLRCSICHEPVGHDADALVTALCPTTFCPAVSHLSCLSRHFLTSEVDSGASIIPRGGTCPSCKSYILWDDVIRGCYRRREGGVGPDAELEDAEEDEAGELFGGDLGDEDQPGPSKPTKPPAQPRGTKKRATARPAARSPTRVQYSTLASDSSSEEGEHFDLDAISSCSDEHESDSERTQKRANRYTKPSSRPVPSKTASAPSAGRGFALRGNPEDDPDHDCGARSSRDGSHRGASHSSDVLAGVPGGRPRMTTAAGAARASNKGRFRGEQTTNEAPQPSREPVISVDSECRGTSPVDPPRLNAEIGGMLNLSPPLGIPPTSERAHPLETVEPALTGAGRVKPKLRPFPDLPPLSPPHGAMGDRAGRMGVLDNELLEISD